MKHISLLINSGKTVFRRKDLELLLNIKSVSGLSNFLTRAKKQNILFPIQNGLWRLKNYNNSELACKLRIKSYISLETVLYSSGIIFQFSPNIIHCISNNSRNYIVEWTNYVYHKIKDDILFDPIGVNISTNTMIATPERALCDLLYLYPNTNVENIQWLNTKLLKKIITIYPHFTILALEKLLHGAQL